MGLRVLHLIDSGGLYGAEKMLLNLVQEQIKQGLEPVILSAGEPGLLEKPIETEAHRRGLPIVQWRMKPGFNLIGSQKILKWAQENKFGLLHSHGFKFNVLLGMWPETIRRIPMVVTLHGYVHARRFTKLWLYECLDRIAIRRMRAVVLVGEAMLREFPGGFVNRRMKVIPNGLDLSELHALSLASLEEPFKSFFEDHESVLLAVGRLSKEKGFDRLLLAFAQLKREFPDLGLVIVGEGGLRLELESLISQFGIENCVLMPGYSNKVASLMRNATIVVMPSLTEGLPITLLEAMSLKTPVIASSVGEMPKVLGDGDSGLLLSDTQPTTIARITAECLIHAEQRHNRAERAYSVVGINYSSEIMAGRYLDLYAQIGLRQ